MLLRSIRSQLLGLVLATVVPFTALIGFGVWKEWQSDQAAAMALAVNEARLLAAQVDDHLGNLENLLIGLSRAVSTNPSDSKANDLLLRQLKAELPKYISNVLLFAPDGTNIGTGSDEAVRPPINDREYFRQVLAGQRLVIGDVIRGRQSKQLVVSIARPVEDRTGRLRAVLVVGTILEHFQDALRVKELPAGSVVTIVNQKGIVIARNVDGPNWIARDISQSEQVMRHLAAKDISEVVVWPDGVERITGSATAYSAPWLVSVGLPTDIAFSAVMRRLGWAALFIAGTLLAAFTIAWMLSGRIVRPLRQLGRDASVLAAGELSHRSAVHTRDEVGALAENFNRMAEALERRQEEARAAAAEVRKAKDTLAAVIDASPVAIVCSSRERRVVIWNRGAERMFGYTPEEALGRSFILVPPEGKEESQELFERAFKGETIRDVELKRMRKDGIRIDVRVTAAPMYNLDGTVRNVAWAYEDITDRKKAEEQLRRLAHYDQLTGLPNRLSLQKELGRLLSGDSRNRPAALVLFDLDGFKDVNDTLGHTTGDELLIEVGQRLINVAEIRSEVGLVCRLGGDEFVVIVPGCGDPRVVAEIVEAILKRVAEPFIINEHVLHIGASAGVAMAPNDGNNVDELIANADLALYQAKSDGGRICRFFLPVLRAQAQARRGLDLELRRAFAENEFDLYFQPQIRLADEAVVGAEALLRWRHPVRGILAPGAFIDTLAESAIAPGVGRWIIRTACEKAASWRAMGLPLSRVAVNLFPNQAMTRRCRGTSRPRSPQPACRPRRSSSRSPNMPPSTTRIRPDRC
jgi:diguanylate cyclase (GGDEF)-like protein/PAS domain S-box-containing protein